MTTPFLGEIQIFGFGYAPRGWAMANGSTVAIRQYTALFSLLGTYYGGNGTTTFQLPNLAHRTPCSQGAGPGRNPVVIGETFGEDAVSLDITQIPGHNHTVTGYTVRGGANKVAQPSTGYLLGTPGTPLSQQPNGNPNTNFSMLSITPTGSGVPHENRQPFLGLTFCISLDGVFPSFN